jgi:hypothetical protein
MNPTKNLALSITQCTSTAPALQPTPPSSGTSLLVASLDASEAAKKELSWFFQDALSAIELQSNHSRTCQRKLYNVRAADNREYDDDEESRVDALRAARTIYERLEKLAPEDLRVLRGLFEPRDIPESLEETCGWIAPLVCARTDSRPEADPEALQRLIDEATGDAVRAIAAYEATRGGDRGCVVPSREEV